MSPAIGIIVGLLVGALLLSLVELFIAGPHRRQSREEARQRVINEMLNKRTGQWKPEITEKRDDYGPN